MLQGEVVYLYVFDLAYELTKQPLDRLLGQPVAELDLGMVRQRPRSLTFSLPWQVRLPPLRGALPVANTPLAVTVSILPVGALMVVVRLPFAVDDLAALVPYHVMTVDGRPLGHVVRDLAQRAQDELRPWCVRAAELPADPEAYTVFALDRVPVDGDAARWLDDHRSQVAALLTEETDPRLLSDEQIRESTTHTVTYYRDDLVVVDWDAALIIDEPGEREDDLYLLELARMQLTELQAYDRLLDQGLVRAYRELAQRRARQATLRELRELQIDLERFSDELDNAAKFLGDWHFARIHRACAQCFHLGDWRGVVEAKLRTLDQLYQIAASDRHHRQMLILEALVVLLFVIDLAMIFIRK